MSEDSMLVLRCTYNGEIINACAADISSYMFEMGLRRGIHYSIECLAEFECNLAGARVLTSCNGVLLEIPSRNKLNLHSGLLGGYQMIADFLRRNKTKIKRGLRGRENGD